MNDREHKRFLIACFALNGAIVRGDSWTPRMIWEIADDMVDSEDSQSAGLPPIKSRKPRTKTNATD